MLYSNKEDAIEIMERDGRINFIDVGARARQTLYLGVTNSDLLDLKKTSYGEIIGFLPKIKDGNTVENGGGVDCDKVVLQDSNLTNHTYLLLKEISVLSEYIMPCTGCDNVESTTAINNVVDKKSEEPVVEKGFLATVFNYFANLGV